MNDEIVKQYGFSSMTEFYAMVAAVDVSTPHKYAAFRYWQDNDGSKAGLEMLPKR